MSQSVLKPLFDYEYDNEWVTMVGRYMLNMGGIELTTRELIVCLSKTNPVLPDEIDSNLSKRIKFLQREFPNINPERHKWAMNVFNIACQHAKFRNNIAHSGLVITETAGKFHIHGILDTPKNAYKDGKAELISLEEIRSRVSESVKVTRDLMDMQKDFSSTKSNYHDKNLKD